MVEGAPLLSEYRLKRLIEGSNPSLSAMYPNNTLVIVLEAFPLEENMYASVAVMYSRCRNFLNPHEQHG